jgi:hypothetical protein
MARLFNRTDERSARGSVSLATAKQPLNTAAWLKTEAIAEKLLTA